MRKVYSARKWIAALVVCFLILLLIMSAFMYIVDPFFQFRARDNTYLLTPQYVNGGLIKNYDYDTLIIGSSMTQNFDMELFRQKMNASPLHIAMGGLSSLEMNELLELARDVGKAENFYICIDLWILMKDDTSSKNVPYLISKDNFGSMAQYMVSHEACFYSLPTSAALLTLKQMGLDLPARFRKGTSIDYLGNWESGSTFSEEEVLRNYNGSYAISVIDMDQAYEIAKRNIDELFAIVDQLSGSVKFFFPPYSGLFWHSAEGSVDTMLDLKRYFVEMAHERGYCVHDFQGQDFISDLNNYKDVSHYSGAINDWMVDCFAEGLHIVTPETLDSFNENLRRNIAITVEKYVPLLEGIDKTTAP